MRLAGWQDLSMFIAVWGFWFWLAICMIEAAYKACKFSQKKRRE